jgi:hypothetical protein
MEIPELVAELTRLADEAAEAARKQTDDDLREWLYERERVFRAAAAHADEDTSLPPGVDF